MKFKKKPVVIEAITFDELVEYGKSNGGNIVNGLPWSFRYKEKFITHENDDCYLIPTLEGTMKFNRGDMLITGIKGEIYPCKLDIFKMLYDEQEKETQIPFTQKEIESLIDISVYSTIVYIQKNLFLLNNDDKTLKEISSNVAKKLLTSYIKNEKPKQIKT